MTMKRELKKFAALAMAAVMTVSFPVEELGREDEKTGVGEMKEI